MKVYGLKTKMTLTVSLLLTVMVGAMALSGFVYFTAVYKQTVFQQEFLLVDNMAQDIDNKLDIIHTALIAVSKTVTPAVAADADLAQAFLDSQAGTVSIFDNHLFLFSLAGKIIAEAPYQPGRRGQDFSHREYIRTTLATGQPCIGAPYISSQSHRHPSVMFTAPVFDSQGQMVAILAGGLDLLRDNFLGLLMKQKIGQSGYFFLYDTSRMMIIYPDATRNMQQDVPLGANPLFDRAIGGFEGTEETVTSRGAAVLSSFKHLQKTNWILAASHPVAEVYAPLLRAQQVFAVVAPVGGLLLLLLLWYALNRMLAPLGKLTEHVAGINEKQGESRFAPDLSQDEVGSLARAFNRMLRDLDAEAAKTQRYNRRLELLREVSLDLMSSRNLDELFVGILQRAAELIGTPHGLIFLLNDTGDVFEQQVGVGFFADDIGRRVGVNEGLVGKVWASGELQVVADYSRWPSAVNTPLMPRMGAMLQAPLKVAGKMVGSIGMAHIDRGQAFDGEDIQVARQFAELASIAYDNVRLYTAAQQELQERNRAQDELRQVNDELERKVEERTMELLALNQELTAMNAEHVEVNRDLITAIEQLRAMQEQLIRSEKMASLGALVAGVAHEINTPVGVSLTAASHLKMLTDEFKQLCGQGSVVRQYLLDYLQDLQEAADIIVKNLERSAKLIRSFKQVSVDQTDENFRTFSLRSYLEEVLQSVQPLLKKTQLHVEIICDEGLTMHGSPGVFAQIVTNLLMNALQHAYDGEPAGNIRISVGREGEVFELRFRDSGKGMDEKTRSKIFDPFFTTKRGSGGTGLGLYIVYNIVTQQFGGSIRCNSAPDQGTEFIIHFPATSNSIDRGSSDDSISK